MALGLAPATPQLPSATILLGSRYAMALALQITRSAAINAMQCVGVVVVLRIVVKRTWLVLVLSTLAILPIAMNGTFAGEQLGIELAITVAGICLVFAVLLRFGLLALLVTFYTFLLTEVFPLTLDFSRPYAGLSRPIDRGGRTVNPGFRRVARRRAAVWPSHPRLSLKTDLD